MPLFKVSVTVETVVFAVDEDAADHVASAGLEEALETTHRDVEVIKDVRELPDEWKPGSLVWHDGVGDLSVQDALVLSQREERALAPVLLEEDVG